METAEVPVYVRNTVRECQDTIRQSEDGRQVKEAMCRVKSLVILSAGNVEKSTHTAAVRQEFLKVHYQKWLQFLLSNLKMEWLDMPENPMAMIDSFFLDDADRRLAFVALCHAVDTGSGFKLNKVVTIMEKFILDGHIQDMIYNFCEAQKSERDVHVQQQQEETVSLLCSLPDKMTAKLKKETSEMFYPNVYMRRLASDIMAGLQLAHSRSLGNKTVDYSFLGQLVGKLCLTGNGGLIWPVLLEELADLVQEDITWCQVCEKLIGEVPERALESVIVAIMLHAQWYGTVVRILGENVTRHKVKFLLTNKLILLRHFKEANVLQNIIGCLAGSPSRSYLVSEVLQNVLGVWSDGSAVRHTSYEQQLYITKAILVCLAMLSPQEKQKLKNKLLTGMMPGIQVHLDSPIIRVRRLGMVVAECVSTVLDPEGPKLKFEYEKDEETELLFSLLNPAQPPKTRQQNINPSRQAHKAETTPEIIARDIKEAKKSNLQQDDDSSDDDLQPYDMSHDVKVSKVKKPLYLRDCMTGLLNSEDPEKIEISLQAAESLIRNHPTSVSEVSVEFARILLHLQDTGVVDGFVRLRHKATVALLVTSPKLVATYLTEEVYGPNYNIRQRLDILEALVDAAQELSSLNNASKGKETEINKSQESIPHSEDQDWRKIVEERIAKKTRRFAHGHKLPAPATLSRFSPVAGYFFFPLLANYDQPERTLDLLGSDHMVLQRLLFSLGVIIHAAVNAPIASQMGSALMKFVWMLRYHPQPAVRRGILFSICMLLLSVPGHVLLTDMHEDLVEIRLWLQDVTESDADEENKKLALHGLVLIQEVVKKELEKS